MTKSLSGRMYLLAILVFTGLLTTGCSQNAPKPNYRDAEAGISGKKVQASSNLQGELNPIEDLASLEEIADENSEPEREDPLRGYNRMMTKFNDEAYVWVLRPVAKGYQWIAPKPVRESIENFFDNLFFPLRFTNNLLQAKPLNAVEETARFGINTTLGLLGFFDPAKYWFGLQAHDEDFGQTLGYWGVGAGPHLVLPILGPSNLRDTFALAPELMYSPLNVIEDPNTRWGVWSFDQLNWVSFHTDAYDSAKSEAIELYPFLREAYEQYRAKKIQE